MSLSAKSRPKTNSPRSSSAATSPRAGSRPISGVNPATNGPSSARASSRAGLGATATTATSATASRPSSIGKEETKKKKAESKFPEMAPFVYVPVDVVDPNSRWITLDLKLIDPQGIGFTTTVRTSTTLETIHGLIAKKHGGSMFGIELYKDKLVRSHGGLNANKEATLYSCGITGGVTPGDVTQVMWYDFHIATPSCALLHREPDLAMWQSFEKEAQAKRRASRPSPGNRLAGVPKEKRFRAVAEMVRMSLPKSPSKLIKFTRPDGVEHTLEHAAATVAASAAAVAPGTTAGTASTPATSTPNPLAEDDD